MSGNRRPVVNMDDWMRDVERRVGHTERRTNITRASDLMGPGLGPKAIQLTDWNDDTIGFNGFFYSKPGALHSPNSAKWWMGESVCDDNGNGFQRVIEYSDGTNGTTLYPNWPGLVYLRAFNTATGSIRNFSSWALPNVSAAIPDSGLTNMVGLMSSGWIGYGGGYQDPAYRKIANKVQLSGLCGRTIGAAGAGNVMAIMPVGYRPLAGHYIFTAIMGLPAGEAAGRVDINSDGSLILRTGPINVGSYVSLCNITYDV